MSVAVTLTLTVAAETRLMVPATAATSSLVVVILFWIPSEKREEFGLEDEEEEKKEKDEHRHEDRCRVHLPAHVVCPGLSGKFESLRGIVKSMRSKKSRFDKEKEGSEMMEIKSIIYLKKLVLRRKKFQKNFNRPDENPVLDCSQRVL